MSTRATEINRLPDNIEEQLQKFGEFYICTRFDKNLIGPSVIEYKGKIYFRFMNFFYLPQPPESLSLEKTIEICDLRLEYLHNLVDLQLNRTIVATAAYRAKEHIINIAPPIKALDFGCGSGLSSQLLLEYLPDLKLVGVDISEKAILESHKQGLEAFLSFAGKALPFETASFTLIFAIFVMHFYIDIPTLVELRRLLRPSGKFVFNLYQRDTDGVIEQLREAGFNYFNVSNIEQTEKSHVIVCCGINGVAP